MAWIGAAIAGGASLLGGAMSNRSNAKEADIQRDWARENAKNAHQYEVADLKAAGLNPILSGTGGSGASTVGGAAATQTDAVTPAVNSALAARRQKEELQVLKSTAKLQNEQSFTAKTQQDLNDASSSRDRSQANLNFQNEVLSRQQLETEKVRTLYQKAAAELTSATAKSAQVEAEMDTSKEGRALKWTNRTTEAAEGATSAVRSAINPFHGPARRNNRK